MQNPLRHIKFFDQASRGPLGAVLVVWSSKRFLASVAACLMVLTILIDPFVQLVFTFPSAQVEDESSTGRISTPRIPGLVRYQSFTVSRAHRSEFR